MAAAQLLSLGLATAAGAKGWQAGKDKVAKDKIAAENRTMLKDRATAAGAKGWQAGKDKVAKDKIAAENRTMVKDRARQQSKMMDYKLAQQGRADQQASATQDGATALIQEQQQQLTQQVHNLGLKDFRTSTYHALDGLVKDGNFKPFNNFLTESNNNPYAPQAFKDLLRVDPVTMETQDGLAALKAAGFDKTMLDGVDGKVDGQLDWKKIQKRFVLATAKDGTQSIRDLLHLGIVTGYGEYTDAKGLAKLKAMTDIKKSLATKKDKVYKAPTEVVLSNEIGAAKTRLAAGKGQVGDQTLVDRNNATVGGKTAGNLTIVEHARQAWRDNGFDHLTQVQLQTNPKARELVNRIELSHKLRPSTIKQLEDLTPMIALATEATQLSSTQTGLWDKMTNGLGAKMSSTITDKEAKASYGAFINQFRHNLFGSALTEGELAAFQDAYSYLGDKIGPVLAGLRAAVLQVKSKMGVLANIEDPMVMKFRAGMSMEQGKSTLDMLDKRIAFYDLIGTGKSPKEAAKQLGLTVGTADPKNVQNTVKKLSVQDMMGQL